jgi:hypothetical protein
MNTSTHPRERLRACRPRDAYRPYSARTGICQAAVSAGTEKDLFSKKALSAVGRESFLRNKVMLIMVYAAACRFARISR